MRRGYVSLVVCAAALAAGTATARPLRYRLMLSGNVTVAHSDAGLQANGSACGLGTPDNTSPFSDHYTVSLRWSAEFAVTLSRPRQTARADVRVSGGQFSYGGYAYGYDCHEIVYGSASEPCAGTVAGGGRASLVVVSRPARKPKRLSLGVQPFGVLTATPSTCTVGAAPQVTYDAGEELGLSTLGQTLTENFKLGVPGRARTLRYRLKQTSNCSQAPQSPGESERCTTAYTASGSLQIRPR